MAGRRWPAKAVSVELADDGGKGRLGPGVTIFNFSCCKHVTPVSRW